MHSFLSKVFGRKKDDKETSPTTLRPGELLDGKFEAVSPNVSPSAANFLELDPQAQASSAKDNDKDVGFSLFRAKSRPSPPEIRGRKPDALPHLSLNFNTTNEDSNATGSDSLFALDLNSQILLSDAIIGRRRLNPLEALVLIRACSQAIVSKGLETLGIMHPHWYSASPDVQRRLISQFIHSMEPKTPPTAFSPNPEVSSPFESEINFTRSPHDVAAVLRWGLRHVQLEGDSFGTDYGWYKAFLDAEAAAEYPPKAFSEKLAPLLPPAHLELLIATLEIFSSLASHSELNSTSGSKLSKIFGLWLLTARQVEDKDDWQSFYARWERTGRMLEHLFLSRIRDESTDQRMPVRLLELVRRYPYTQGLSSPTTDLQLLPPPRFTSQSHDAFFVRIEVELPSERRKPKLKVHPLNILADAFSTKVEEGEFAELWAKITAASKNGSNPSPLSNIFADETIRFLSIIPDKNLGKSAEVKSPAFSLLPVSPSPRGQTFSTGNTDKPTPVQHPKSATEPSPVSAASPLAIGSDWVQFSSSGFLDTTPAIAPLVSTLFDTDIEKTIPTVTTLSRKSSKRTKAGSRKSVDFSSDPVKPIPEVQTEVVKKEPVSVVKATRLQVIQVDEAFIDFWSDSLLDPITATWPTFIICKFKSTLVPELGYGPIEDGKQKTLKWLVLEQVITVKPAPAPTPAPLASPSASNSETARPVSPALSTSGRNRFSFWNMSRTASSSSQSSQKGKKKEKAPNVGEMGELLEEEATHQVEADLAKKKSTSKSRKSTTEKPKELTQKSADAVVTPAAAPPSATEVQNPVVDKVASAETDDVQERSAPPGLSAPLAVAATAAVATAGIATVVGSQIPDSEVAKVEPTAESADTTSQPQDEAVVQDIELPVAIQSDLQATPGQPIDVPPMENVAPETTTENIPVESVAEAIPEAEILQTTELTPTPVEPEVVDIQAAPVQAINDSADEKSSPEAINESVPAKFVTGAVPKAEILQTTEVTPASVEPEVVDIQAAPLQAINDSADKKISPETTTKNIPVESVVEAVPKAEISQLTEVAPVSVEPDVVDVQTAPVQAIDDAEVEKTSPETTTKELPVESVVEAVPEAEVSRPTEVGTPVSAELDVVDTQTAPVQAVDDAEVEKTSPETTTKDIPIESVVEAVPEAEASQPTEVTPVSVEPDVVDIRTPAVQAIDDSEVEKSSPETTTKDIPVESIAEAVLEGEISQPIEVTSAHVDSDVVEVQAAPVQAIESSAVETSSPEKTTQSIPVEYVAEAISEAEISQAVEGTPVSVEPYVVDTQAAPIIDVSPLENSSTETSNQDIPVASVEGLATASKAIWEESLPPAEATAAPAAEPLAVKPATISGEQLIDTPTPENLISLTTSTPELATFEEANDVHVQPDNAVPTVEGQSVAVGDVSETAEAKLLEEEASATVEGQIETTAIGESQDIPTPKMAAVEVVDNIPIESQNETEFVEEEDAPQSEGVNTLPEETSLEEPISAAEESVLETQIPVHINDIDVQDNVAPDSAAVEDVAEVSGESSIVVPEGEPLAVSEEGEVSQAAKPRSGVDESSSEEPTVSATSILETETANEEHGAIQEPMVAGHGADVAIVTSPELTEVVPEVESTDPVNEEEKQEFSLNAEPSGPVQQEYDDLQTQVEHVESSPILNETSLQKESMSEVIPIARSVTLIEEEILTDSVEEGVSENLPEAEKIRDSDEPFGIPHFEEHSTDAAAILEQPLPEPTPLEPVNIAPSIPTVISMVLPEDSAAEAGIDLAPVPLVAAPIGPIQGSHVTVPVELSPIQESEDVEDVGGLDGTLDPDILANHGALDLVISAGSTPGPQTSLGAEMVHLKEAEHSPVLGTQYKSEDSSTATEKLTSGNEEPEELPNETEGISPSAPVEDDETTPRLAEETSTDEAPSQKFDVADLTSEDLPLDSVGEVQAEDVDLPEQVNEANSSPIVVHQEDNLQIPLSDSAVERQATAVEEDEPTKDLPAVAKAFSVENAPLPTDHSSDPVDEHAQVSDKVDAALAEETLVVPLEASVVSPEHLESEVLADPVSLADVSTLSSEIAVDSSAVEETPRQLVGEEPTDDHVANSFEHERPVDAGTSLETVSNQTAVKVTEPQEDDHEPPMEVEAIPEDISNTTEAPVYSDNDVIPLQEPQEITKRGEPAVGVDENLLVASEDVSIQVPTEGKTSTDENSTAVLGTEIPSKEPIIDAEATTVEVFIADGQIGSVEMGSSEFVTEAQVLTPVPALNANVKIQEDGLESSESVTQKEVILEDDPAHGEKVEEEEANHESLLEAEDRLPSSLESPAFAENISERHDVDSKAMPGQEVISESTASSSGSTGEQESGPDLTILPTPIAEESTIPLTEDIPAVVSETETDHLVIDQFSTTEEPLSEGIVLEANVSKNDGPAAEGPTLPSEECDELRPREEAPEVSLNQLSITPLTQEEPISVIESTPPVLEENPGESSAQSNLDSPAEVADAKPQLLSEESGVEHSIAVAGEPVLIAKGTSTEEPLPEQANNIAAEDIEPRSPAEESEKLSEQLVVAEAKEPITEEATSSDGPVALSQEHESPMEQPILIPASNPKGEGIIEAEVAKTIGPDPTTLAADEGRTATDGAIEAKQPDVTPEEPVIVLSEDRTTEGIPEAFKEPRSADVEETLAVEEPTETLDEDIPSRENVVISVEQPEVGTAVATEKPLGNEIDGNRDLDVQLVPEHSETQINGPETGYEVVLSQAMYVSPDSVGEDTTEPQSTLSAEEPSLDNLKSIAVDELVAQKDRQPTVADHEDEETSEITDNLLVDESKEQDSSPSADGLTTDEITLIPTDGSTTIDEQPAVAISEEVSPVLLQQVPSNQSLPIEIASEELTGRTEPELPVSEEVSLATESEDNVENASATHALESVPPIREPVVEEAIPAEVAESIPVDEPTAIIDEVDSPGETSEPDVPDQVLEDRSLGEAGHLVPLEEPPTEEESTLVVEVRDSVVVEEPPAGSSPSVSIPEQVVEEFAPADVVKPIFVDEPIPTTDEAVSPEASSDVPNKSLEDSKQAGSLEPVKGSPIQEEPTPAPASSDVVGSDHAEEPSIIIDQTIPLEEDHEDLKEIHGKGSGAEALVSGEVPATGTSEETAIAQIEDLATSEPCGSAPNEDAPSQVGADEEVIPERDAAVSIQESVIVEDAHHEAVVSDLAEEPTTITNSVSIPDERRVDEVSTSDEIAEPAAQVPEVPVNGDVSHQESIEASNDVGEESTETEPSVPTEDSELLVKGATLAEAVAEERLVAIDDDIHSENIEPEVPNIAEEPISQEPPLATNAQEPPESTGEGVSSQEKAEYTHEAHEERPEAESLISTDQLPTKELPSATVEEPITVDDLEQPIHDNSLPDKSDGSSEQSTIEDQSAAEEPSSAAVEEPTIVEDLAQSPHNDSLPETAKVALEQPVVEESAAEPETESVASVEQLAPEELPTAAVEEPTPVEDLAQPSHDESLPDKLEVPLEQPEDSAGEVETEPLVSTEQLATEELPSAVVEEPITVEGPRRSSHDDSLPENSEAPLDQPTIEESAANPTSVVAESAAASVEEETATEPSEPTEQSEPVIVEQSVSTLDESPSEETSVDEQTSSPKTAIVEDAIPVDSAEITVVEAAPTAEKADESLVAHVQEPSPEETIGEELTAIEAEPSVLQELVVALDEDVPAVQPIVEQTESKQEEATEADDEIFIEEAEAVDATLSPEDFHEMLPSPSTEFSTVDPDESFATSGPFALESVMSSIGEETDDIDDNDPILDVDSKVSEAEDDILNENGNGHYSTSDVDLSEPIPAFLETDKELLATQEATNGHSHKDADTSVVEVPSADSEPLSTALDTGNSHGQETEKSALSAPVSSEEGEPATVETLGTQESMSTSGEV